MNVLGIIPARGGSKAIPRKNLASLGGRPLIQWTIDAANQSNLTHLIVSTDDTEIAELANSLHVEVPGLRPQHLATDEAKTIDVVLHVLEQSDSVDAVMVLQPTSPFRTPYDINTCLAMLQESDADSVISVVDVGGFHPGRMKYLEGEVLIDPPFAETMENQPRQELRPMYIRNGAIYLTRSEVLRRRTFKGDKSLGYVMPVERSINIDDPFDLQLATAMLSI
jgi:CMP-N,N'-diacetyllegionaminic acid synthase